MVTSLAAPNFSMVALAFTSHAVINKPTMFSRGTNKILDFTGNKPDFTPVSRLRISKRHTRACLKSINGKARLVDDMIANPTDERLLEDKLVFQQNFTIRSYEIGSDFKISIEALVNYLQDTGINHLKSAGIAATFGRTLEMTARDLIWVVGGLDIQVDCYPSWTDVVQVETWIYRSGRNSFYREWRVRNFNTGKTLIRADSLHVMMNTKTRKFAKVSEEVMKELKPFLVHCDPDFRRSSRKLLQLDTTKADYIRTGLTPGWTDMDVNHHLSHIKLINYVLEGVPPSIVESHEISTISLEYKKECNRDSVLQSSSRVVSGNQLMDDGEIEFDHLLCLECGQEIVRGRTLWKPKCMKTTQDREVHTPTGRA